MKRLLVFIPLVILCCLGCQQSKDIAAVDVEADIQAIKDIIKEYEAANNAFDVDRIMKPYAENAMEFRPNEPAFAGKEAIRNRKKLLSDEISDINENYVVKNVEVSGDLAVAHVIWSTRATLKKSGETVNPKGNWIWVFKRRSNMTWELFYSIWSNEDLIFPSEVE